MTVTKIDDVIRDLRLHPYSQDWGIICADRARLNEFADYLVAHSSMVDEEAQGELVELILASADDGSDDPTAAGAVARALAACLNRGALVSLILRYWQEYWRMTGRDRLLAEIDP